MDEVWQKGKNEKRCPKESKSVYFRRIESLSNVKRNFTLRDKPARVFKILSRRVESSHVLRIVDSSTSLRSALYEGVTLIATVTSYKHRVEYILSRLKKKKKNLRHSWVNKNKKKKHYLYYPRKSREMFKVIAFNTFPPKILSL